MKTSPVLHAPHAYVFSMESNAPLGDVKGHNTSSTIIFVQWRRTVLPPHENGTVLNYTVTYKALLDGSPQTKAVGAPTTQVTLTGLNEYTNYSITVFASNVYGNGKSGDPFIVITDENSKLCGSGETPHAPLP